MPVRVRPPWSAAANGMIDLGVRGFMTVAVSRQYEQDADDRPVPPGDENFEAAVGALNRAVAAVAQDALEARCDAVCAATEAVTSLYLNLDVRRAAARPDELAEIYSRILGRLLRINLYNDTNAADEAIALLRRLRPAFPVTNPLQPPRYAAGPT